MTLSQLASRRFLVLMLAFLISTPCWAADASETTTLDTSQSGEPLMVVESASQRFEVYAGESWRDALTRWSTDAGYTLVWRAPTDVLVEAPITFEDGTAFEAAVGEVLKALWHSRHAVAGTLYRNRVLVITGRDA